MADYKNAPKTNLQSRQPQQVSFAKINGEWLLTTHPTSKETMLDLAKCIMEDKIK